MTIWSESAFLCAYHHKDDPDKLVTEIYQGKAQATKELYDRLEGRTIVPQPDAIHSANWAVRRQAIREHAKVVREAAKELAKDYVLVTFKLVRNG